MNNGAKPSKLSINIEVMPFFSASMADAGLSPVLRVNVSGFEHKSQARLEISVVGKCGENEFLQRKDFTRECFCPDNYNLKTSGSCAFDFKSENFTYDNAFLKSLHSEQMGEIYVMADYGNDVKYEKIYIRILPFSTWCGLEADPTVLASFVLPQNDHVKKICSHVSEENFADYNKKGSKKLFAGVEEIYKSIKECNLIYSRPSGYSSNALQSIRLPDELFTGSSALATPLEITLLFCACAEKCGYDPTIIFVRGQGGKIQVLCGVWLKECPVIVPVFEDYETLCGYIAGGELLVVDPSVFAAAQNTSFRLASENAANEMLAQRDSLVCLLDISLARRAGIKGLVYSEKSEENKTSEPSVKNGIASLYSSLKYSPVMKMLSGINTEQFCEIPLLLTDFEKVLADCNGEYKLCPFELNVSLYDFASFDNGFSSILTANRKIPKYSASERGAMEARFASLKKKLTIENALPTSLKEERLYSAASEMVFGKDGKKPYIAFGYVKITDKLTELVSFAPVCLVEALLTYKNGDYYVKQNSLPLANKVFLRNAMNNAGLEYDSFMKSNLPTDKKELFDLFENVRTALCEMDDRHNYEIVREAHIINCDLSDYVLWRDLALERKKITESEGVALSLGVGKGKKTKSDDEYVPSKLLSENGTKCVCTDNNAVLEGLFSENKLNIVSSACARQIVGGKTVLIVTKDKQSAEYVSKKLCEDGLTDAVMTLDGSESGPDVASRLKALLEKYADFHEDNVADMPKDALLARRVLKDYSEKLDRVDKSGMSIKEAVYSYFDANRTTGETEVIPLDPSLFDGIDEEKLDALFTDAGLLITGARRLCESSGMKEYSPVSSHPLFHTRPKENMSQQDENTVVSLVNEAVPVLSEYRDTFADVSQILGIEQNEIKTQKSLKALNELYKLVLSARETEIPEDFLESDIEDFSQSINRLAAMKKRREAIEFKLNFFSPEIFEDVETLLVGDSYEESEKGFLKKFIHKKDGRDLLSQYVTTENKAAFLQKDTEEIYRLLYEYKAYVKALRKGGNENISLGSSYKLALLASEAGEIIDRITGQNPQDRCRRLSGVFRLITVVPVDASLARRINVVRAKYAELYGSEQSCLDRLSEKLGLDLDSLSFDGGILSFDGLSHYLREIVEKLDVTDKWIKWQSDADRVRQTLPGFVDFIEKHGAVGNVDRIFAKSLLLPVCRNIKSGLFTSDELEKVTGAKEKYIPEMKRACEISANNTVVAYSQSVRHCAKTNDAKSLDDTKLAGAREFLQHNRPLVSKVLPVIITTRDALSRTIPQNYEADLVIAFDSADDNYKTLPALSFGHRVLLCNMSGSRRSTLCENMISCGAELFTDDFTITPRNPYLCSWLSSTGCNEGLHIPFMTDKSSVQVIRMNGIYERAGARINKTEAELCLSKALELLSANPEKSVAVTAFTTEMCAYLEKCAYIIQKKSAVLSSAIRSGKISFVTPDRLWFADYDYLIASACFSVDKNGRAGWEFGNASVLASDVVPDTVRFFADKPFEKMYLITSLNPKDSKALRRMGNSAKIFNSLCEALGDGRIPVSVSENDISTQNSIVPGFLNAVDSRLSRAVPCDGKNNSGASLMCADNTPMLFVFFDGNRNKSIHDELLYKADLEEKGYETMTVSPAMLCDDDNKTLINAFRRSESIERNNADA